MQLTITALQFQLQTAQPLAVPQAKYANVVRGALGVQFRAMSCVPDCVEPSRCPASRKCQYAAYFEADMESQHTPGGMATPPRPFVLRVRPTRGGLCLGIHLFGPPAALVPAFTEAALRLCSTGLGPGRVPASITQTDYLDSDGIPHPLNLRSGLLPPPVLVPLLPDSAAPRRIRVHFLTPTELKHGGGLARNAEFPALFARVRDRVLFYATRLGPHPSAEHGPLARSLAEHAAAIQPLAASLRTVQTERQSTRTGQRHQIGGFLGHAEYAGDFRYLWPWLLAAQWTGVGRQTAWGKGHIRCEALPPL